MPPSLTPPVPPPPPPLPAGLPTAQLSRAPPHSYLPPAALEEAIATALANPGVHVAELDVSSCGLEELPPLVASFSALRSLRAKYNRLARLPVELLAALPRLEAVDLEGNRVAVLEDGALQALGDRLRSLNLSGNGLAALPDGVGRCRALEALTLANNPLVQLPEALASCPALSHLDVSSCRLVALPAALAGSKSLQRFFCQVGADMAGAAVLVGLPLHCYSALRLACLPACPPATWPSTPLCCRTTTWHACPPRWATCPTSRSGTCAPTACPSNTSRWVQLGCARAAVRPVDQ